MSAHRRDRGRRRRPSPARAGPSIVGIGRHTPRQRRRHRRRPGPDQRPQPARRRGHRHVRRRALDPSARSPASMATATSPSSPSTRPALPRSPGAMTTASPSARPVFGVGRDGRRRRPRHVRPRLGGRRARSAARAAAASPAASSTPHRWRPDRPVARCVDAAGTLVGLNTNRIGEGFYLALPADAALRARVDALGRGESPKRLRLGVAIAPSHVARRLRRSVGLPERDGVLVRGVEDDSLAAAAGIEAGDLIVSAGGKRHRRWRRPVRRPRLGVDARSRSGSSAAPRSAPSRSARPQGRTPGDAA